MTTLNGHIGVLGTAGTVNSESYPIELKKWSQGRVISTVQEACPMWVPIVENNEIESEGAEYFVKKNINNILKKDNQLDTLILGCTHYPLLIKLIKKHVPPGINIIEQGEIVAEKLTDYLRRHQEIDRKISKTANVSFHTTESAENFNETATFFMGKSISCKTVQLS